MKLLEDFRKPFDPKEVKWRVGSTNAAKDRGLALAYIDARNVMDRLDEVVGPYGWQNKITILEDDNRVLCSIGIKFTADNEWIWKTDGAGATDIEGEKGGISDAFKRAAVHWGIGRYLYALDSPWVALEKRGRSYAIAKSEMPRLAQLVGGTYDPASDPEPQAVETIQDVFPDAELVEHNLANTEAGETNNDEPVSKDTLREHRIWPRLFALAEKQFGKDDSTKFKIADEVLKQIGVGKMANLKHKHLPLLIKIIEDKEAA